MITIDTNGLRPKLRQGLTERIEKTLGQPDCCRLDGPPRLPLAEPKFVDQAVH